MVGSELTCALSSHEVVAPPHTHVDISDATAVEQIIAKENPNFIINAAAIINMSAIEQDPASAMRVNVMGAAAIAHAAAKAATPQLLVSSSYVFGEAAQPYDEDAVKNPINAYGETKAAAEDAVAACKSNAAHYIVRTSWIYSTYRDTFVDEVAKTLREGKPFVASLQRGNPTQGREFAVTIITNFIDSSLPKSGVYHVVNEGSASRYEMAREIARTLHLPETLVTSDDFPSNAIRPSVVLKNTKLPPLPPWEVALRRYLAVRYAQK